MSKKVSGQKSHGKMAGMSHVALTAVALSLRLARKAKNYPEVF